MLSYVIMFLFHQVSIMLLLWKFYVVPIVDAESIIVAKRTCANDSSIRFNPKAFFGIFIIFSSYLFQFFFYLFLRIISSLLHRLLACSHLIHKNLEGLPLLLLIWRYKKLFHKTFYFIIRILRKQINYSGLILLPKSSMEHILYISLQHWTSTLQKNSSFHKPKSMIYYK